MTTIWLFMQAARILSALMVLINQTLKNTDYEHILDDKLDVAPPGVQFDGVDNTSDVAFGLVAVLRAAEFSISMSIWDFKRTIDNTCLHPFLFSPHDDVLLDHRL